ncbi:MAG: hypothetical protein KY449_04635 [Proteobacteria bacterium]|nr:hypothetical protein [Pseudomonadota bacterium]
MKTADLLLSALLAATAASPAAAETAVRGDRSASPTVAESGSTGSAPQARMICRRQETTGARTGGELICLTKEQWRIVNNGGSVTTYQKRVR